MARTVALTEKLIIELFNNEDFKKRFPTLCKYIEKAPGVAFKKCESSKDIVRARKYWNFIKKYFLKLSKEDIDWIKSLLNISLFFIRYIDEYGRERTIYI